MAEGDVTLCFSLILDSVVVVNAGTITGRVCADALDGDATDDDIGGALGLSGVTGTTTGDGITGTASTSGLSGEVT